MGKKSLPTIPSVPQGRIALRVAELAQALGMSRQGLYNLINRGEIRATKLGGVTVVLATDLETFIQKCRG